MLGTGLRPVNAARIPDWGRGVSREILIADLISGPLAGKAFKFHQTDPATGERSVRNVDAEAGAKLRAAIEAALPAGNA